METMSSQKPRILIVDDVEANRFILRNIIVDMGFQPVLAENGVQALKVFPRCSPQRKLRYSRPAAGLAGCRHAGDGRI